MKIKSVFIIPFFILLLLFFSFIYIFYSVNYPLKYKENIKYYSLRYGLKPELVASLINKESSFNKDAVSSAGAIGLMQILPSTALYISEMLKEENIFKIEDLYIPEVNIKYGCYYLKYLKNKFNDEKTFLAAYNAGETIVFNWLKNNNYSEDGKKLKVIPYLVTERYATKIISTKKFYLHRI